MRRVEKLGLFLFYIIAGLVALHLLEHEAWAAENSGNWRFTFDLVMRWLNFGILAFFLIKFTKTPIKDFLLGKKEEIARRLTKIEEEKEEANQKIAETLKKLDESEIRFVTLKERIVEQGQKKKQQIIKEAKQESKILLDGTMKKIDNQLIEARNTFKSELIDAAIALALERLPNEITANDHRKLLDQYIDKALAE